MATGTIGQTLRFPILNADGTSFHGLIMNKAVVDSVVMSLGDKITGDVYYLSNSLVVTMHEYIEYQSVNYVLVNPPTVVREGMVSDNGELKGMTKYSFEFYHPMYMLGNFPFSDVAVSADQKRYLSENKAFAWIGYLPDFVAKINKNLEGTEWVVTIGNNVPQEELTTLSEVITFDKNTIADALKKGYEIWGVPYVVDKVPTNSTYYEQGKRFLVQYGLPTQEILVEDSNHNLVPFVFHFGQGVGLKNNSRTPRNNKIVTRIAGYGSEDNIPYGYPQIPYVGGICQYPLYYGIVGGQRVQLIKHPFTRNHLMPSIYRETLNKKVNPMADGYNPDIELIDYYDADGTYENPIKPTEPSYEIHEFEKIKPELGEVSLVSVKPFNQIEQSADYTTRSSFLNTLQGYISSTNLDVERHVLHDLYNHVINAEPYDVSNTTDRNYQFSCKNVVDGAYSKVTFSSSNINFTATVLLSNTPPAVDWDDTMDDNGEYVQSFFKVTLPPLMFDLYASAAVTQEMTINMRSGACLGCSFPVQVDWEDYKRNFYDSDGNFAPNGSQRDLEKYPNSRNGAITVILQKEIETFGTLMPNIYQKPKAGDKFVILGISLPTSYIESAERRLDADMKQYMRDNNVYYYDYPLKFDEHFLASHTNILSQMKSNILVRFDYAGTVYALYIKQMTVKYENKPLPTYDITLTDDVEIVLNQIGQVTDEVSRLRVMLGGNGGANTTDDRYLRRDVDDTANGTIRFIKGLQVGERFVTGLLGEGGVFRREEDGTTYIEADKLYIRMKAYFDSVEIRDYKHSAGNRIQSPAGARCCRVVYLDANDEVVGSAVEAVKFRCFFLAKDGEDEVRNNFVVGDQAYCHVTTVETAEDSPAAKGLNMKHYWRLVVGRNSAPNTNGEHWIDLSNRASETLTIGGQTYTHAGYQSGSDVPIAQDDIIQLGNINDRDRQGAIIEFVTGADAPSYQVFQGINDFSLNGKNYIGLGYSTQTGRAYLNVYGDTYIGDPNGSTYVRYNAGNRTMSIKAVIDAQSTIDGQTIEDFIAQNTWTEQQITGMIVDETDPLFRDIDTALATIQHQVDGSIETWFYNGAPSASVLPESAWKAADQAAGNNNERLKHLGDLYYDNETGYAYRYANQGTESVPQFVWNPISDSAVVKALADAARAQDTADNKRRVFVVQPVPPYDAGDLWVNATYPSGNTRTDAENNRYHNDVLRCNTAKAIGGTFAITDWGLASKYTDDQALQDFKANQYVQQLTNGNLDQRVYAAQQGATNAASLAGQAEAHAATFDAIKQALNNGTIVDGGLVLSTLIGLRDRNGTLQSGINGAYSTSAYGGGLAAWFGGGMLDRRNQVTGVYDVTGGAKIGFRFDGSGYLADGGIAWDSTGLTKVTASKVSALEMDLGGDAVATQDWVGQHFLSVGFFNRLFRAYNGNTLVAANDETTTIDNIKAMFGFWTEQYVSALGNGGSGSGDSGVSLNQPLASINAAGLGVPSRSGSALVYYNGAWRYTTESTLVASAISVSNGLSAYTISVGSSITAAGSITTQAGGFRVGGKDDTYVLLAGGGTMLLSDIGGGAGTVTGIKIGTAATQYSPDANGVVTLPAYPSTSGLVSGIALGGESSPRTPTNGIVSLPAYPTVPTKTSQLTNDSGFLTSHQSITVSLNGNTYNLSQGVISLPAYPTVPTKTSQLTNDSGFLTSHQSITVALNGNTYNLSQGVISLPAYPTVPTKTSQLTNDSGFLTSHQSITVALNGNTYSLSQGVISLPAYPSLSGYATQSWVTSQGYTTNVGTVTSVKVGSTSYSPSSGVISLPAYPATGISSFSIYVNGNYYNYNQGVVSLPNYPTNTWRGVQDNLTSSSNTTESLAARQGYLLANGSARDSTKVAKTGDTMSNALIIGPATSYSNYNEGVRIVSAANGWAGITFGAKGSAGMTPPSGQIAWFAAKSNQNKFIISPTSSADTIGLTLNYNGDMLWRNNVVCHSGNIGSYIPSTSFSGSPFYSGNSNTAEHNCNNAIYNGHYYYNTNGPAISLGATTNDGALYVQAFNTSWVAQIAQDYRNGGLFVRGGTNGTWQSWYKVWDSRTLTNLNQLTNGPGFVTTNTKNTAGAMNLLGAGQKLYLVGAPSQLESTQTYTMSPCYMDSSGYIACTRSSGRAFSFGESNQFYIGQDNAANFYMWGTVDAPLRFGVNGSERVRITSSGTLSIGSTNPGGQKLYVNGSAIANSWSTHSDMRLKSVVGRVGMSVEDIARAPIFSFRWNNRTDDNGIYIGTSAQYWQDYLPNAVTESNGWLGLDYNAVAVASAVTVAKETVTLKEKVLLLETRVRELEEQLYG